MIQEYITVDQQLRNRIKTHAVRAQTIVGRSDQTRYRSALRTLISVVIAIFIPVQADANEAEAVATLEYHRIREIVQTNGTRELLPQLLPGRSACSHFIHKQNANQHFRYRK